MPMHTVLQDGGLGGHKKAAVTSDCALRVTQIDRKLSDLTIDQLTRVKFFNGLFERADGSGSTSLNVDGSVTPVDFVINPPAGQAIQVRELRFILEGGDMSMTTNDARKFSTAAGTAGLTNGLECFIEQGGEQNNIFVEPIQHMSEFFNYITDFYNVPDGVAVNVDILTWVIDLKLLVPIPVADSSVDRVVVRVNDNLTSINKFQVLTTGQREAF